MKQKEKCIEKTGTKLKSPNMNYSNEVWNPIRGIEYYYHVSSMGRVRSRYKLLTPRAVRGYYYVILEISDGEFRFRRNIPVHRLVAQEFHINRLKRKEVNHIDGNKLNNKADNLEWVSREENQRHAYALGLHKMPTGRMKFTKETINSVFTLRKLDWTHREIAEKLGMGISTVTHTLLGSRRSKQ